MPRSGKNNERTEQVPRGRKKSAKVEPLRPQAEHPDKLYNDLAKFPSENPYPVLRIHRDGTVLYANKASEPLLKARSSGVGQPAPAQWLRIVKEVLVSGCVAKEELKDNGHVFLLQAVPIAENNYVNFYGVDITERKTAEEERELTVELLSLINSQNKFHELMKLVTVFLKNWSGCEAVGIRLQDGEDFPYFETSGFPEEFVLAENKLCSVNEMGKPVRDSQGRVFLECMCGNIISGRFDPTKPFFTKHGSFWTNSTTELLAATTNADRLAKTRNRCNTAGYESVTLIPLRTGKETLGLLQFNSKQKDQFTPEKISLLERLADNLAIGLAQRKAEEALKKSNQLLRDTGEMAKVGGWEIDLSTKDVSWTEETCRIHGVEPGHKISLEEAINYYAPESRPALKAVLKKAAETGKPWDIESLFIPSGSQDKIWVRSLGRAVYGGGKIVKLAGTFQNIDKYKKAEEKIREGDGKYRSIVENSGDQIFMLDKDYKFLSLNKTAADFSKKSVQKIIGRSIFEIFPETTAAQFSKNIKNVFETGKSMFMDEKMLVQGHESYNSTCLNPVIDDRGIVIAVTGIVRDITERKRAEEALRDSEVKFRTLFENMAAGTCIDEIVYEAGMPVDYRILDVNSSWEKITGISRSQAVGSLATQLYALEKPPFFDIYVKVAETGEPVSFESYFPPIGKHLHITASCPARGRFSTVVTDMTEHKQAEKMLRESEERYKNLFMANIDGILVADATTKKFRYANPAICRILGYSEEELTQMGVADIHPKESLDEVIAEFEAQTSGAKITAKDLTCVRKDGQVISVSISAVMVMIDQTKYLLGIFCDITERKRVEHKIIEYQKHLKQLAARLTLTEERERRHIAGEIHDEISQTLAMVKIKLDTLRNSPPSEASAAEIGEISSSVENVIQKTRTLTFELSNPLLYVLGLEAAVAEWLSEQVQKKHGIATDFQDDGKAKPLDDDVKVMLFRNVRELRINCIKHANAGKVRVNIRRIDDSIEVAVEDNGVGFDPAEVRLTAGKRAKFGLFSIRESLENLGGHFKIESKPGAGCKAIMTAPLKDQSHKKEV